nr:hypothetical protein [candidate division Zixibacteria bacterium]
ANGGFEAGVMAPWTTTRMAVASSGARTGSYWAYYFTRTGGTRYAADAELTRWCDLKQKLGRAVRPNEFLAADLWIHYAPDNLGNPWHLELALGPNELRLSSSRGELARGWNRVTFPRRLVTLPFDYVYVKPSFTIG